MRTYTTKEGDMWDAVARRELGATDRTAELMMRNRAYLRFYTLPAGIVLTVPETAAETVSDTLPPWKRSGV